jgi:hypothetical protein
VSNFCEHCQGQRFDRARVIRILRELRKDMRKSRAADQALAVALNAVKRLDIPHLEVEDEEGGHLVH